MCLINVHIPKYGSSIINFIHECSAPKNNDIHWRNFYQISKDNPSKCFVNLCEIIFRNTDNPVKEICMREWVKALIPTQFTSKTHLRLEADL